jgi:hypothetical protein
MVEFKYNQANVTHDWRDLLFVKGKKNIDKRLSRPAQDSLHRSGQRPG